MQSVNTRVEEQQKIAALTGLHQASVLPSTSSSNISFEFFPPCNESAEESFWRALLKLEKLQPHFVSVTCGADGSTRDRTQALVSNIRQKTCLNIAPHITCVGQSKGALREIAQQYWADGIRHVVALRGDLPKSPVSDVPRKDQYLYASELVHDLKLVGDFDITVAAYPEVHPEAASARDDMENLKRKLDAGASRAFSQFFFVTDNYLRFRDQCALYGIDNNVVPGILPITNFQQIRNFAKRCGTQVPSWLAHRFKDLEKDSVTHQLVAASFAMEQIEQLRRNGVDKFHFYTLNQSDLTYAACHTLGIKPQTHDTLLSACS